MVLFDIECKEVSSGNRGEISQWLYHVFGYTVLVQVIPPKPAAKGMVELTMVFGFHSVEAMEEFLVERRFTFEDGEAVGDRISKYVEDVIKL